MTGDAASWVSAISAAVSAVFGGLAWFSSRKSKAERIKAQEQADRAEAAAELVTWEIRPGASLTDFRLRNTSANTAFHVTIEGGEAHVQEPIEAIEANSEHGFSVNVNPAWNVQMTVTWYQTPDKSGPMRRWTGGLPNRPTSAH
ncbi:hypothetical protein [Mycobacterium paraense]|uniref:hypothetical protein n=1 Tax=Mycobacterium paraense TaxID=767916 RepID=UPI00115011AE|nr:hypothetical protein [Mycobacterium paraense]